jgi:hypothetical protein
VTFLGYTYSLLLPLASFQGIAVADAQDIACMKLSAIASRGTKRDFVDLYIASQKFGLRSILQSFEQKFAEHRYNKLHILKSLTYFEDAEKDPMPHMLVPLDWKEVMRFFLQAAPQLL